MKNIICAFFLLFSFSLAAKSQTVKLTLHNGSSQSIPLSIPGVMNPNLSPFSTSGVSLDIGQEVYFFPTGKGGKRALLFVVDKSFKSGSKLEIDAMIKEKRESLK